MAPAFALAFSPVTRMGSSRPSTALAILTTLVTAAALVIALVASAAAPVTTTAARAAAPLASAAGRWLTSQPILFLLLNAIIFAVAAPSGLFSSDPKQPEEEPPPTPTASPPPPAPASPPPPPQSEAEPIMAETEQPPSAPLEQPLEQPKPHDIEQEEQLSLPRVKVKRVKRSTSASSTSRLVKRNQHHQRSHSVAGVAGSPRLITMVVADDSNRENIPPSWGANGNATTATTTAAAATTTSSSSCSTLKDEDFKEFIDSFIARARHQMILQEQMEMAAERAARRRR